MADWWVTVEKYELGDVPGLGECALGQELGRLAPGDWRVTVHDDGKADVVPLQCVEWDDVYEEYKPLGSGPYDLSVLLGWDLTVWADAPEPQRSDTSEASRENDR